MNTTHDLRHKISKNQGRHNYAFSIRLNDECRNGHEDFSITGDFWTPGKERTDRNWQMGGCCHDEILKVRPDLAIFVKLHLCDFNGAPMYAVGNGFYNAKRYDVVKFSEYFNVPVEIGSILLGAEDQTHFHYLVQKNNVPAIWSELAKEGRELLEQMTGEKFESKATKSNYSPLSAEDFELMEQRVQSGYYHISAIVKREEEAQAKKLTEYLEKLAVDLDKETAKHKEKYLVKKWVAEFFKTANTNFIFYDHNKTLAFNFHQGDYYDQFSPDQIKQAQENANLCPVPITITTYKK